MLDENWDDLRMWEGAKWLQETPNLKLKNPDLTNYVNVGDLNDNAYRIDEEITENKGGRAVHLADYTAFKDDITGKVEGARTDLITSVNQIKEM